MGVTKDELLALEDEKLAIEKQLEEASMVLANNNIGMDEPLVDAEDFPRSDISVYEVRHARAKIIRLRNDLKDVTSRLSKALEKWHQAHPACNGHQQTTVIDTTRKRLAKIEQIEAGSPADTCGLLNGDYILEIGNVNGDTFQGLIDIANEIKMSENSYMRVVVERDNVAKRINLKPKIWATPEKGLLGCRIVAVPNQ
ncbi:26S proteasome non-ATPase regulatory subunit [Nesidiocoris tenuis]|uniref:26S proteasome non-ATPase regulatory subunit n=1 Tax=Nesidiocoris tenuis TaxID=355587 RepID=A0ABN7B5Z0_9HEMI|nr:26S proteasome non-ATPase regulatory subunit [Nesidiocoris tenuis]